MSNIVKFATVLGCLVFGVWFYFTPHIAFNAMKAAIDARDAERLAAYVDFPALKDSVKSGINARIATQMGGADPANPFAALGAALAGALISPLVEALVTPESLAMILQGDRPEADKNRKPAPPSMPAEPSKPAQSSGPVESAREQSMGYESFNRFVVSVKKKGSTAEPLALVFGRDGWFTWKLIRLRLPW